MKKIILLVVILIFTTGCSPMSSVLGPSDGDNNIDFDDAMDDISVDLEHESNMSDGRESNGDIDLDEAMDDISTDLEHEDNMSNNGDDGNDIDFDNAMDDISVDLEHESNMSDGRESNGDIDFDDAMDDISTDLEHENNMLDEGGVDPEIIEDNSRDEEEERRGGSCNAIAKTSTCIDYVGSFWTETQMKYSCSYSGIFSFEPCEAGSIGGCNVGKGSFNDMIIWMYPYGGSPIANDTVKSAKPACDMNPMGNWLSAR